MYEISIFIATNLTSSSAAAAAQQQNSSSIEYNAIIESEFAYVFILHIAIYKS